VISISKEIPHPDYKSSYKYFDIALVQLAKAPNLGPVLRPACLPDEDDDFASRRLLLSGWGAPAFGKEICVFIRAS